MRDAARADPIRRAVTIERGRATDMRGLGAMLDCRVRFGSLPIDVAFKVLVRVGDREWPAASAALGYMGDTSLAQAGMPSTPELELARDFPEKVTTVDVILRSN